MSERQNQPPNKFIDDPDYDFDIPFDYQLTNPQAPFQRGEYGDTTTALGEDYVRTIELDMPPEIIKGRLEIVRRHIREDAELARNPAFLQAFDGLNIPEGLKTKILPDDSNIEPQDYGVAFISALAESPAETLGEFLTWNTDRMRKFEQENQELLEAYSQEFTDEARRMITEQNLPLSIEQFETRMADIEIRFADVFSMSWGDLGGSYDGDTRVILVAATENKDFMKQVVFHELWHHLSGQTLRIDDNEGFEDLVTYDVTRVGLRSSGSYKYLNEAVTEQLTQISLDPELENIDFTDLDVTTFFGTRKDEGTYIFERQLTSRLFSRYDYPYTLQSLLGAYFEDHNPQGEPGHRADARRRLGSQILANFGRGRNVLRDVNEIYTTSDNKQLVVDTVLIDEDEKRFQNRTMATPIPNKQQQQRITANKKVIKNWRKRHPN